MKHRCKSLSVLEITEDNLTEEANADGDCDGNVTPADLAEISLHAILSNSVGATMKLQGEINSRKVLIHIILLLER